LVNPSPPNSRGVCPGEDNRGGGADPLIAAHIHSVIDGSYDVSEYRRQLVPEMDEAAMPLRR
jgi:hypothetical protein